MVSRVDLGVQEISVEKTWLIIECYFKHEMSVRDISTLTGLHWRDIHNVINIEKYSIMEADKLSDMPIACWRQLSGTTLNDILNIVYTCFGEDSSEARIKHIPSLAKSAFCHVASTVAGFSGWEIGSVLGINSSAVYNRLTTSKMTEAKSAAYANLLKKSEYFVLEKMKSC